MDRSTVEPPEYLLCPISKTVFVNPHIAADGHTYSLEHIKQWLETKNTSPITKQKIAHKELYPNIIARELT